MIAISVVAVAAGAASAAVGLLRWLRVAQREHYLPGSCSTVLGRWLRRRPPNNLLVVVAIATAVASVALAVAGLRPLAPILVLLTAALAVLVPFPMSPLGRGKRLVMTRRATVLAAVTIALGVLVCAVAWLLGAGPAGPAVAAVAMPFLVDAAAMFTGPFEKLSMERHRRRAQARLEAVAPRVVAVTGSWGKTSTKNHLRDLLAGSVEVVASPASWNNTGGLSRTINEHLTDSTEILVAEMGMYRPGEIAELCSWIRPEVAVICAVGPMHLERVGSMEGIVAAKAEIAEGARAVVLWVDHEPLAQLAGHLEGSQEVWRVGTESTSEDLDVSVRTDEAGVVRISHRGVEVGSYPAGSGVHPGNAACAVAAALAIGQPPTSLGSRVATLSNPAHRSSAGTSERGVWVLDDTFNSNPVGAKAAVDALAAGVPDGRRAVVTPGMVELGPMQHEANRALAAHVVASGATLVVVGWTNRVALLEGSGGQAVAVATREEGRDWVRANLGEGDGVLWENDLPDHYP